MSWRPLKPGPAGIANPASARACSNYETTCKKSRLPVDEVVSKSCKLPAWKGHIDSPNPAAPPVRLDHSID